MKSRCYNKHDKDFTDYGGRGVKICRRWLGSCETFISDMGLRPDRRYRLDRFPNTDGDYKPGNCRWATSKENARNKRASAHRFLVFAGRRQMLCQWVEELGIPRTTIATRLRLGWSTKDALTTPSRKREPNKRSKIPKNMKPITYRGQTRSRGQWSRLIGVSHPTISNRLNAGWSIEKTLTTPSRVIT